MKIVEALLSFRSDPSIIDTQGCSCLHAASKGSIEMVNWFLKGDFNPDCVDRDG